MFCICFNATDEEPMVYWLIDFVVYYLPHNALDVIFFFFYLDTYCLRDCGLYEDDPRIKVKGM